MHPCYVLIKVKIYFSICGYINPEHYRKCSNVHGAHGEPLCIEFCFLRSFVKYITEFSRISLINSSHPISVHKLASSWQFCSFRITWVRILFINSIPVVFFWFLDTVLWKYLPHNFNMGIK